MSLNRTTIIILTISLVAVSAGLLIFTQNIAYGGAPGILTGLSANPANTIGFKGTQYAIVVDPASSASVKKIIVTFPTGTTVPADAKVSLVTLNGLGLAGSSAIDGPSRTVTFTLTSATLMTPSDHLFIYIQKVRNPANTGTGPLSVNLTVETRDASDFTIDGPTNLGYNIQPDYLVPGAIKANNTSFKVGIGNNITPDETLTVGGNLKIAGNIISDVATLKIIPKAGGDICIGSGC